MKYTIVLFVLTCMLECVPIALGAEVLHKADLQPEIKGPGMQTNIALLGKVSDLPENLNLAIVDPTNALQNAANLLGDIQEDPRDRFITSKDGRLRPKLAEDADEWADEELVVDSHRKSGGEQKVLSRKKRCGGNDDDGDARRSRRARRARRARRVARRREAKEARRARKAARASTSTTTVVRKVIQNGQVVSQTTQSQGVAQPGQVIVQHQPAAPIVQTVQPGQVVVQKQPVAPLVQTIQPVQPAQPVAVAQPAAAAAVTNPGVPSIAVTGSVKVN